MKLLVIAGHGKKSNGVMDNGAGGNGYNEAERVRTLANRIKAYGGESVTLGDQSKKWIDYGLYSGVSKGQYDAVIELHMDSSESGACGGHVVIKNGFKPDKYDLALESFIKSYFPGRSVTMDGRGDLAAVNTCASRGINFRLLEVCFISNSGDLNKFNAKIDDIAKGILSAFGVRTSSPVTPAKTPTVTRLLKPGDAYCLQDLGVYTSTAFSAKHCNVSKGQLVRVLDSGTIAVKVKASRGGKDYTGYMPCWALVPAYKDGDTATLAENLTITFRKGTRIRFKQDKGSNQIVGSLDAILDCAKLAKDY